MPNDTLNRVRACCSALVAACFLLQGALLAADRSVAPIVSRIQREPVESSGLAAIGYRRKLHALEIEFRDGLIYRYLEVPLSVYHDMMAAESKARFYNNNVRGKYHCLRVRPPHAS
ncbi:MAG: KTSC domain-containing protein [Chthoniobacterales bacterium]